MVLADMTSTLSIRIGKEEILCLGCQGKVRREPRTTVHGAYWLVLVYFCWRRLVYGRTIISTTLQRQTRPCGRRGKIRYGKLFINK